MSTPSFLPNASPRVAMDREESNISNVSTASGMGLYESPYFSRSPSGGSGVSSDSGGDGDRMAKIQKEIKLLDLVSGVYVSCTCTSLLHQ